jgi:hypothetical protein
VWIAARLRDFALRCRAVADESENEDVRATLLQMADDCERGARELDAETQEQSGPADGP